MNRARQRVIVIGAGAAGLAAAEVLSAAGHRVEVFDAMPSPGRKFLLAGIGGLNLTHSENEDAFRRRYGAREGALAAALTSFDAQTLREWAHGLGIETFVGSSGRVFPRAMKAAPLLRAWLQRLRLAGVTFHVRQRWLGWEQESGASAAALRFASSQGIKTMSADAVILALGGASWARLGSDGAWAPWLRAQGVSVAPFRPANCGFEVRGDGWSEHFRTRFAGQPLKSVTLRFEDAEGNSHVRSGECVVTQTGLEGSLIYALSAPLRDTVDARGAVTVTLDLAPGRPLEKLVADLGRPRGTRSFASHLQSKAGITGVKAGLLRECVPADALASASRVAETLKALPLTLVRARPLDEAISTAGGVAFEDMDGGMMLRAFPGVFCCGEMLDWEAPTGGYLLTACFATGRAAGAGAARWLAENTCQPRSAASSE